MRVNAIAHRELLEGARSKLSQEEWAAMFAELRERIADIEVDRERPAMVQLMAQNVVDDVEAGL